MTASADPDSPRNSTGDSVPGPAELFDLTGKVAVVTGASRGIGEAVARCYAKAGAKVALLSRTQEALDAVAETIRDRGGEALPLACHTGEPERVEEVVGRVVDAWGGVDILVNNAGTNPHFGPLVSAGKSYWDKTFEVNLQGYVWTVQAVVPAMKKRGGGSIVNVASIAGITPFPGLGIYGATKAAVLMLTRQLASELLADGIRVNAIAPGLIRTRFSEALWKDPERSRRSRAVIPMDRFGEVEELLGPALLLAADSSSFITGQTFIADGGQTLGTGRG